MFLLWINFLKPYSRNKILHIFHNLIACHWKRIFDIIFGISSSRDHHPLSISIHNKSIIGRSSLTYLDCILQRYVSKSETNLSSKENRWKRHWIRKIHAFEEIYKGRRIHIDWSIVCLTLYKSVILSFSQKEMRSLFENFLHLYYYIKSKLNTCVHQYSSLFKSASGKKKPEWINHKAPFLILPLILLTSEWPTIGHLLQLCSVYLDC